MVDLCMPVLCNTPTARCWKLELEHKGVRKKNKKTQATTLVWIFCAKQQSNIKH